jgi:hypothetical protein
MVREVILSARYFGSAVSTGGSMNLFNLVSIAVLCAVTQTVAAKTLQNASDSGSFIRSGTDAVVVQLREDSFVGAPDGPSTPPHYSKKLESTEGVIANGIYSSPYQGYQVRIPKVANNPRVHVHQALVARRPDGTVITSHVLFVPDGGYGAQAVVVTRLRDDRPKDPAAILAQFEPHSPTDYAQYEKQGIAFKKIDSPLGTTLQRTIRNRGFSWHFPYRVLVDSSRPQGTVGVSRYVVVGNFLCEFSVIVDGASAATFEALQALAERDLDVLTGAMLKMPQ